MIKLLAIYRVWKRYILVYQRDLKFAITSTFIEPLLTLLAFGFGLSTMIDTVKVGGTEVSYRLFIVTGIIGQTIMFQSFFESAYGAFVRLYYQKFFQSIAVTTILLDDAVWAERLWAVTKVIFAVIALLIIAVSFQFLTIKMALLAIPISIAGALLFSSLGMLVAGNSPTIDAISYPQHFIIMPQMLFCGVFYPIEKLPIFFQYLANLFPLTAFLSLLRTLLIGTEFQWFSLLVFVAWLVVLLYYSKGVLIHRMVK